MDAKLFEGLSANFFVDQSETPKPSRRDALRLVVGAGAGLVIGASFPERPAAAAGALAFASDRSLTPPAPNFTPFIDIRPDNTVVVLSKHLDKGQGIATGLATLVAEELDADWSQMRPAFAPADASKYKNLAFGVQGTGGSSSIANSYEQYRKAGAAARAMLVAAAAKAWGVPPADIKVSGGVLSNGNRTATFGELASMAALVPVPDNPKLKSPAEFKLIGKKLPRLDTAAKSRGAAVYTQDVKLDNMLVAVVAHPPWFGGKVKSFDARGAKSVKGVVDVVDIKQGVAVLATTTYAAIKGREALQVEWDDSAAEKRGTPELIAEFRKLAATSGAPFRSDGDIEAGFKKAVKTVEAEYLFPYLAHAPMEPMNAVAQVADGKVTIWTGCQFQTVDQMVVASLCGVRPEDVTINTLWAGGSFGRRAVPGADYIAEAALIAKTHGQGRPIKLVWTREDDTKGGRYRPMVLHKVKAGIDASGAIVAWQHRIVGQSIIMGTPFEAALVKNGVDSTAVEGVSDSPYTFSAFHGDVHMPKTGVPVLWWRSVGHTHTAFVMETMIDELAAAAGADPVQYRMALLAKHPRHQGVLKLAAEKAGWSTPPPDGVKRGVAVHESFKSFVAEVAEVRMIGGKPRVTKVTAAVDCGVAVNPDVIAAQVEGGIGFGLGAILHSKITLAKGEVEQTNFDAYEVLRMDEAPEIFVHIVPSAEAPSGIGEPAVPPLGPAVANAVAQHIGRRIRVLPFDDGLKSA